MNVEYLGPGYQGDKYLGEKYKVGDNKFYVYFPKSVGDNSLIHGTLYYTGAGGYTAESDGNILTEMYNNKDIDFAYISPTFTSYGITDDTINSLLDYIKDPNSDSPHHFEIDINDVGGFSLGGGKGTKDFVSMLHKEYSVSDDVEQKRLLLYDPYGYGSGEHPTYSPTFTDEDIKLIEKNHSQIVLFTNDSRMGQTGTDNAYPVRYANDGLTKLAQSGDISPIIISSNIGHGSMPNEINRDGWKLYFEGMIELEDIHNGEYVDSRTYEHKVQNYRVIIPLKDENNNVIWQSYQLTDLVEAKKNPGKSNQDVLAALNYVESTIIKSEFKYVERANELIAEIGRITNSGKAALSHSSKSALLPQEISIMNNITSLLGKLQTSCVAEIRNILNAGEAYKTLDKKLALDADKFGKLLAEDIQSLRVTPVSLNDPSEKISLYTTNDLRNKSVYDRANLTAADINMIIDSELKGRASSLKGSGAYWLEAANKTGLDPLFLLALARQESGLGTSEYAKRNNFFGMKYQNGVQYFGQDGNGNYVVRDYANSPEEGIIKASEWIKEFYVEKHGGDTTQNFGLTGYNGGNNYGDVLSSIMGRMKQTYETTTGRQMTFIDASNTESKNVPESTPQPTSPTGGTPISHPTYTPTQPSSPTQPSGPTQPSNPDPTPETKPTTEPEPIPKPEPIVEPQPTVEPETVPKSEPITEPKSTVEPEPITEPEVTTDSEPTVEPETTTDSEPSSDTESTPVLEPTTDPVTEVDSTTNYNKNNRTLNTIGVVAGIGAAAAAGAYGAKKLKEKIDEKDDV